MLSRMRRELKPAPPHAELPTLHSKNEKNVSIYEQKVSKNRDNGQPVQERGCYSLPENISFRLQHRILGKLIK